MRCFLNSWSSLLLVLILLLFPRIGISQNADRLKPQRFRTGYFAKPIEIPGDVYRRKITSFQVVLDTQDKVVKRGLLVVDDRPMKFDEFGDATATNSIGIQEHPVSFVNVTAVGLSQREAKSPVTRAIYRLDFDETFCDRNFFLNVPKDPHDPVRLLICKAGGQDAINQNGSKIESMFRLVDLAAPVEVAEDGPTLNDALFSTSMIELGGRFVPGFEIQANLVGTGTIQLDQNHCEINDYGDGGMQTALGFIPTPARFIPKNIADPQNLGRRVFELKAEQYPLPKLTNAWETVDIDYSIVVAAKSSGDHRLIIKRGGQIAHVIPLLDMGWRRHVADLGQIKNERAANASRKLRRLCGNASYVGVENGDIRFLRLGPNFSDEAITVAGELGELTKLMLDQGGPEFTGTSFEAIGKLEKLESLALRNSVATDRLLEIAGKLPRLRELSIYQASESSISDEGIARLAESVNLESLILPGTRITDKCLSSLEDLKQLKVLELNETAVTVPRVVAWRLKNPACRISIMNDGKSQQRNVRIPPDVSQSNLSNRGMHVELSGKLTQSDYESLSKIKTIETITLPNSANLDNLKAILTVESLRSIIMMDNDNANNEFIKEICKLTELRELHIKGCRNLDRGCVQYLKSMSKLERLSITSPEFDSQTLRELREEMPNCQIEYY